MYNSRNIDDLKPAVKILVLEWLQKCKIKGIDVAIISTKRDGEYQDYLFSIGRSNPGDVVTNSQSGESYHEYGNAWDFAILKNNKIDWKDIPKYKECGKIGELLGLRYGGSYSDYGHLEKREASVDKMINEIKKKRSKGSGIIFLVAIAAFVIYKSMKG